MLPRLFCRDQPGVYGAALRAILRDARQMQCPLGIFPEGVAGTADQLNPALPGVDRLFILLAKAGLPVLPACVSESGRLIVQFGTLIDTGELVSSSNAAGLVINRIGDMAGGISPTVIEPVLLDNTDRAVETGKHNPGGRRRANAIRDCVCSEQTE